MLIEENKDLQSHFQDILNKDDFSIIGELFDKDYMNHIVKFRGFEGIIYGSKI